MNASPLIPKPIVDSLGRSTTKWVRPDEDRSTDRLSSAPTLASSHIKAELKGEHSTAFENRFISINMVPSEYGSFNTVKSGSGTGSAVVISNARGEIMMVSQNRYAVGEKNWEIPRGGAASEEDRSEAAQREVKEETGIDLPLASIVSLGNIHPDTGILSTEAGLFYAATEQDGNGDSDDIGEIADRQWFPADDVVNACVDGTIKDSFTTTAILRARMRGFI